MIIQEHNKRFLCSSGPRLKEGQVRQIHGSDEDLLLLVGLGKKARSEDSQIEGHDLSREAIRTAVSTGVRSLKDLGVNEVLIGTLAYASNQIRLASFPRFSHFARTGNKFA